MALVLKDIIISSLCRLLRPFFHLTTSYIPPRQIAAILILKPCCRGDVLMTTPLIAALRRTYPNARLDFAVGSHSRAMVETNPKLDGLVDCGQVGSGRYSLRDYLTLVNRIQQGHYKACFVPDRSPLITLLPALAGIPWRVGLDSHGRGFSLSVRIPINEIKHEVELYLDLARAIGIPIQNPHLEFYPTDEDRARVASLLAGTGDTSSGLQRTVIIHPGGGVNPGMVLSAKRWPPERFGAVAQRLSDAGHKIILVGGPEDIPIAAAVRAAMNREPIDLTGRLSFGELGALAEGVHLFIGNDTGALHLAVAMGVPVVALYGPSDPRMYGPYGSRSMVLWHPPACSPCLVSGRWNQACHDYQCIRAITVEEVYEAALSLLDTEPKPSSL